MRCQRPPHGRRKKGRSRARSSLRAAGVQNQHRGMSSRQIVGQLLFQNPLHKARCGSNPLHRMPERYRESFCTRRSRKCIRPRRSCGPHRKDRRAGLPGPLKTRNMCCRAAIRSSLRIPHEPSCTMRGRAGERQPLRFSLAAQRNPVLFKAHRKARKNSCSAAARRIAARAEKRHACQRVPSRRRCGQTRRKSIRMRHQRSAPPQNSTKSILLPWNEGRSLDIGGYAVAKTGGQGRRPRRPLPTGRQR